MDHIQSHFKFKNNKVEPPNMYLGVKLRKIKLGTYECWTMSSYNYVQSAIKNVENKLAETDEKIPQKAPDPIASGYKPEL